MTIPAERPTLPSLASLCLPDIYPHRRRMNSSTTQPSQKTSNVTNDNGLLDPLPLNSIRSLARPRVSSVSSDSSESSESSTTSTASTASTSSRGSTLRVSSKVSLDLVQRHHPYFSPARHRVVLSDRFSDADIILSLPLPAQTLAADPKRSRNFHFAKAHGVDLGRAQFLFGDTAKVLRVNERVRNEFPAAIHPYRIIPRHPSDPKYVAAAPTATAPAAQQLTPPPAPVKREPSP